MAPRLVLCVFFVSVGSLDWHHYAKYSSASTVATKDVQQQQQQQRRRQTHSKWRDSREQGFNSVSQTSCGVVV
ncbi:hypothetical protein C0Q70_04784 [Pomacea canaliculata]|uniref:Secreted protein n=1 Tax=Pomacea canaliculata TaxID=400727 RepID=A0A2T7PJE1_POMCA|nr:hypothetical protein C0Q70_04784 [Pomacea canaliculata]